MSVDLSGDNPKGIIGYRSKKNSHYIDLSKVNFYEIEEFWEPIYKKTIKDTLILEPEEFYILASKEKIRIPTGYAAELVPFEAGSESYAHTTRVSSTRASATAPAAR